MEIGIRNGKRDEKAFLTCSFVNMIGIFLMPNIC